MSQHTVFTIQDNLIVNKLPYVEIRITSHTDLHFYTLKKIKVLVFGVFVKTKALHLFYIVH